MKISEWRQGRSPRAKENIFTVDAAVVISIGEVMLSSFAPALWLLQISET